MTTKVTSTPRLDVQFPAAGAEPNGDEAVLSTAGAMAYSRSRARQWQRVQIAPAEIVPPMMAETVVVAPTDVRTFRHIGRRARIMVTL